MHPEMKYICIYIFFHDFEIKFRLGKVTQIYSNEAEARELPRVKGQSELWSETLSQKQQK